MELERGPVAELPALSLAPIAEEHRFLELAIEQERENGVSDTEIGILVDTAYQSLYQDARGDTEGEVWEASQGVLQQEQGDLPGGWEDITAAAAESDELMLTAYQNVPGESFSPVPPPVSLPADPPTFDPVPEPVDDRQISG